MMIRVSEDIVPAAKFKRQQSAMLRRLRETRRPLIITQHGTPAAVVITPEEYDRLACERRFRDALDAAESAEGEGRVVSHHEAKRRLDEVTGRGEDA